LTEVCQIALTAERNLSLQVTLVEFVCQLVLQPLSLSVKILTLDICSTYSIKLPFKKFSSSWHAYSVTDFIISLRCVVFIRGSMDGFVCESFSHLLKQASSLNIRSLIKLTFFFFLSFPPQVEISQFDVFDDVMRGVKLRQLLWESVDLWQKQVEEWSTLDFHQLIPEDMNLITAKIKRDIHLFETSLPPNLIVPKLNENVETMQKKVNVVFIA
jgi:hypothetical protein